MCFLLQYSKGKLAVIGSVHMFSDQYLDKEENNKIMDVLFKWLTTDEVVLNAIDAEDPEVKSIEYRYTSVTLPDRLLTDSKQTEILPFEVMWYFVHSIVGLGSVSLVWLRYEVERDRK